MGASALVANSELPQAQKEERVTFSSHSTSLVGTLVWPASRPVAAVAFVHGSGRQERNLHWARSFAADGMAALVYDKRGVGESGGDFEEQQSVGGPNIRLLADDAVAAVHALSVRLPMDETFATATAWIGRQQQTASERRDPVVGGQ
jgi:alpha-beta hydrolase superfamily lysophospholipase